MDLYQLHSILAENRDLIAHTWEFFVTVNLAIIGILYVGNKQIPLWVRITLLIPYSAFMYLNYRAQIDNYTYASEILNFAQTYSDQSGENSLVTFFNAGWVLNYLSLIYISGFIFGSVLILQIGGRAINATSE